MMSAKKFDWSIKLSPFSSLQLWPELIASHVCLDITSIAQLFSPFAGHTIPLQQQLSLDLTHKVASTIKLKIKAKVATTIKTNSNVLQILSDNCMFKRKVDFIFKFE